MNLHGSVQTKFQELELAGVKKLGEDLLLKQQEACPLITIIHRLKNLLNEYKENGQSVKLLLVDYRSCMINQVISIPCFLCGTPYPLRVFGPLKGLILSKSMGSNWFIVTSSR